MGLFLVEVAAVCFKGPQFPQNLNIVLGYLFLKKSVSVYENLHGFLKGDQDCEDEIKVTLTDKERKVYEKK